jgi:hypothetical protein
LGLKEEWNGADNVPKSSIDVMNAWSYTSTPPYDFMISCVIKQDNYTFTLIFSLPFSEL